jgi:hypothetical protein
MGCDALDTQHASRYVACVICVFIVVVDCQRSICWDCAIKLTTENVCECSMSPWAGTREGMRDGEDRKRCRFSPHVPHW